MAIAEIKWKLVKDTYFFDTTTCYLSENGNHLFYIGKEKQIEILIDSLNELVRKGCAMWLKVGEYEFALDKLSKCSTQTWYSIHQKLYSLEPWGIIKESKKYTTKSIKKSARKSIKESNLPKRVYDVLDELAHNSYLDYGEFVEFERNGLEHHFDKIRELGAKLKKADMKGDDDLYQKIVDEIVTVVKRANGTLNESRKSIKEYNYDSHNKSWVSDSVEKVYTNGLEYKNDWCALSLYKDEYENLVNYLLDEKGFILEKKYTKKLGYDIFINEKLDLYVVIMNETTYGFFDEKHFIIRFGDELGDRNSN